jgi:hypothetical protein
VCVCVCPFASDCRTSDLRSLQCDVCAG